ncbi:hypothetical protein [Campylobacter concisus]|jgi:hypothetical protein|uniref:hypothetical protein n=1 Tax=Campylobacter concisus TaxID=199 RepID=UPI000CD8484F|nr:hypothetical protein [Campylobacter concisus]
MKKYIFPSIEDSNKILYLNEEEFEKYQKEHNYPEVYPHGIIEYDDFWIEAEVLDKIFEEKNIKDLSEFINKKAYMEWRARKCQV